MSSMRPIRLLATTLLVVSVAMAGCAKGQSDQTATPSSAPASVTTKAPTVNPPPSTRAPKAGSEPVVLVDGRHPVYIKTIDPDRRTITFDLIQFYWGDEAAREAASDHKESPPPNDHYIRNVNPRLRTLPVRADATITVNTLAAGYTGSATKNVNVQLYRLQIMLDAHGDSPPFWITVQHDQVVRIAEQYIP
jgi:hypothetical protein